MKNFKTVIAACAVALLLSSLPGCNSTEQADTAAKAGKKKGDGMRKKEAHGPVTRAEAEQKVLKRYKDGYLIANEVEWEAGKMFYEIQVKVDHTVYEVLINAETGQVKETEDNTHKFREDSTAGKAPMWKVDLAARDAAEAVALNAYPGEVQQWKAAADSGRAVFNFRIKSPSGESKKVVVKAGTNEVLKIKF